MTEKPSKLTNGQPLTLTQITMRTQRAYLRSNLRRCNGNVAKLAKLSAVSTTTLYRRMRELDVKAKTRRKHYKLAPTLMEKMRASTLFEFFGVQPDPSRRYGDFWSANSGRIDFMLFDARRNWHAMVLKLHPDRPGGDAERMAKVNAAFTRLEQMCVEHGYGKD